MNVKKISLLALMIALSGVGALIKIPSPVGSVALDSLAALVAAALLGPGAGAIIGALGHLFSAYIVGFPLGVYHFLIAPEMAVLAWIFGILYAHNKRIIAGITFIVGNAVVAPVPFIFFMNWGFYTAIIPSLLIASTVNTVLALLLIPRLSSAVKYRFNKRDAH